MQPIYAWVVKALQHPAVQAFLEVIPFVGGGGKAASGAAEAIESGTTRAVEEGVTAGTTRASEGAVGETAGEGAATSTLKGTDPAPVPYNRAEHYGNPATSKAAKEIRANAEGQPCPSCGKTMKSGTKNAPTAQHSPTLKPHYYSKGHKLTAAQRRAYARSKESTDGAICKECQSKEGAAESRK